MTFKKLSDARRRSVRIPVMMSQKEREAVRQRAKKKGLCTAEFTRQAVFGRIEKTDVQYELQVISDLRAITEGLHLIHEQYLSKGIEPPKEELNIFLQETIETIRSISY